MNKYKKIKILKELSEYEAFPESGKYKYFIYKVPTKLDPKPIFNRGYNEYLQTLNTIHPIEEKGN